MYHSSSSRKPFNKFSLKFVPVRHLFGFGRDLSKLEELAETNPLDARQQAKFYRAIVDEEPELVIKRFENSRYARDRECASLYLAALYETNQLDRAAKVFLSNNTTQPVAEEATTGKDGTMNPYQFINFGTKENPVYVQNMGQAPSGWRRLANWLNFLVAAVIIYSVVSMNESKLGGITTKVHKFFKKDADGKHYTFDDVQGCDEAKKELEEVVEFLKNPAKFNKLGAKMPKGVLLVGPPGTGKTLLAKAVAGEADVPFIYASGSQFDEVFVGVGSMRIRQMFDSAKEQAPAIIFIDEIDAIGSKRNPRDPQHSRMSLNQLLTEMDGFAESTGVVVIAATNLPDSLDKALLRPGRFDRHVHVPLPDVRGRRQILEMYLKEVHMAPDVDTSIMARATPGFSGADLFKMINQAKITASLEDGREVTMRHLELAKDEMIMGVERKSAVIMDEDRKVTAYHESGHAIAALHSKHAHPIHKATIMPRGQALGMVAQLPERDEVSISKAQLLARMDVAMGGRVAEMIVFGEEHVTTGASSDFNQANGIARAMVTQYGMSEKVGPIVVNDDDWETLSPQTRELIDSEVRRLLEESQARAKACILANRAQLDKLATALLDYETLTREEIELVITGKPITMRQVPVTERPAQPQRPRTPKFDLVFQ
jgi:ATP-dependent metalloprotease